MNLGGQTREVPVIAYAPLASWIDKTVKVTLADPDASVKVFALNGNVSQEISLDEIAGSVAAEMSWDAPFSIRTTRWWLLRTSSRARTFPRRGSRGDRHLVGPIDSWVHGTADLRGCEDHQLDAAHLR